MVKISILYPREGGSRFDLRYYTEEHMPLSITLLSRSPGFRGVSVEHGVTGAQPGTDAAYVAMCHYLFESADSFVAALLPFAEVLRNDMSNYTDIQPIVQVSDVLLTAETQTVPLPSSRA